MKPDDRNGNRPTAERPFRVFIIAGSNRRQYNCPGVDSKARTLMLRMAERLPQSWEIDIEDLGNVYGRARIQSCNACVSTSMALCVWPCNCYEPKNEAEPDLMWDLDMYSRLDLADAWAIIGPVNWYGPSSNLKLMFDRLVCANGGNPREDLIDHKNPELAMKLEKTDEWERLTRNHLEGRTSAFFSYGDGGGSEIGEDGRPRILRHKKYFDPDKAMEDDRRSYAPLVWQCRYGGIEVPDPLWRHAYVGAHKPYSEMQAEHMVADPEFMRAFDQWTDAFAEYVAAKGKVEPGELRAYGYTAPGHRWADLKLGVRHARMAIGKAPQGSSPRVQHDTGLNQDARIRYRRGEGKKIRG
jgi:multimeric flavodoxin WrbA